MKTRIAAFVAALLFCAPALAAPEAFPDGFNNLPSTHWMRGRDALAVPYPARWACWFDDFTKYTAGDWVITTTEAGGGDATEALSDADRGILLITNDSNDNDLDFFQTVAEMFDPVAGSEMYFEARLAVNDATQTDFFIGFGERDTTPLTTDDFMGFWKDDDDALLDFHSESDGVQSSSTALHTVVADTYITVAFYYTGSQFLVAVDNVLVATTAAVTPSDEELTVSFGIQNGTGAAKTMSVDYIWACKERP